MRNNSVSMIDWRRRQVTPKELDNMPTLTHSHSRTVSNSDENGFTTATASSSYIQYSNDMNMQGNFALPPSTANMRYPEHFVPPNAYFHPMMSAPSRHSKSTNKGSHSPPFYMHPSVNRFNWNYATTHLTAAQYMQMLERYNYINMQRQQHMLAQYYQQMQHQPVSPTYDYHLYYPTANSVFNKNHPSVNATSVYGDDITNGNQLVNEKIPTGYEAVQVDEATRDNILRDFKKEAQVRKRKVIEYHAEMNYGTSKKLMTSNNFSMSENSAFVPTNSAFVPKSPVTPQTPKRLKHYDQNNNHSNGVFSFPEVLYDQEKYHMHQSNESSVIQSATTADMLMENVGPGYITNVESPKENAEITVTQPPSVNTVTEDKQKQNSLTNLIKSTIVI